MTREERVQQIVASRSEFIDEALALTARDRGATALARYCRVVSRKILRTLSPLEIRLLGGDKPHSWQGALSAKQLRSAVWDFLVARYGTPWVQALQPTPSALTTVALPDDCPVTMPRTATGVVTTTVENYESWSDHYHISTTRSRKHWILWHSYSDEEGKVCYAEAAWPRPPWSREHAALFMIREIWQSRARDGWKPHYVEGAGFEGEDLWQELMREVWPDG